MHIKDLHQLFLKTSGISTDTRKIIPNSMFFALKGGNFNANEFAFDALEKGCKYAVIDEKKYEIEGKTILVENVLKTLQNLANYHRKIFSIPIIGITGSNGKTTTKELIGEVLKQKFNTLMTSGNLNNHIGVPLTLLQLDNSHEIAVIEMGANKPGDIKELSEICEPTHGIITNIGSAHIEGFGSLAGVIKTKSELYQNLEQSKGILFVNDDDEILNEVIPKNTEKYTYGIEKGEVKGAVVELNPFLCFTWQFGDYHSPVIHSHLVGKYNLFNFLAAIRMGCFFGVENEKINQALANYKPSNNRSQVTKTERNDLIVDCYNANPTSMMNALESFVAIQSEKKKILFLGDMLELGAISESEHLKIIDFVKENQIETYLVGAIFSSLKQHQQHLSGFLNPPDVAGMFEKVDDLIEKENLASIKNALILLKGSRGIKLERLIDVL